MQHRGLLGDHQRQDLVRGIHAPLSTAHGVRQASRRLAYPRERFSSRIERLIFHREQSGFTHLLVRPLRYTGVRRAQRLMLLIAEAKTLHIAAERRQARRQITRLTKALDGLG
ncbi:hypothetical protein [Halochromatium sp.]